MTTNIELSGNDTGYDSDPYHIRKKLGNFAIALEGLGDYLNAYHLRKKSITPVNSTLETNITESLDVTNKS